MIDLPLLLVAGSSVNLQAFYDAFYIRTGDPMWHDPADQVGIW